MTARFESAAPGFNPAQPSLALKTGTSETVTLVDAESLDVTVDKPEIAVVQPAGSGVDRAFLVSALASGQATLQAIGPDGSMPAYLLLDVSPQSAAFRSADPTRAIDDGVLRVGYGESVEVVLDDGAGLCVVADPMRTVTISLVAAQQSGPAVTYAILGVKSLERATITAWVPDLWGNPTRQVAAFDVVVGKRSIVAQPTPAAPAAGDQHTRVTAPAWDIPDDLIEAAENQTVSLGPLPVGWQEPQGYATFTYFVRAVREMFDHAMPARNAMLLTAQASVETGCNTRGPNVPHYNALAFQPLKPAQNELARRGIGTTFEPRGNDTVSLSPVPMYHDLAEGIQAQLEIALPMYYSDTLPELRDPTTQPLTFASTLDRARYGTPYVQPTGTSLDGEYHKCNAFVRATLSKQRGQLSDPVANWAEWMALQLPVY